MQKRSVDQNTKEKRKTYYNDNKDKLLSLNKKYYYDNIKNNFLIFFV